MNLLLSIVAALTLIASCLGLLAGLFMIFR